jgi:hypothetical protein
VRRKAGDLIRAVGWVVAVAATFVILAFTLVLGIVGNVFDVQQYLGESGIPLTTALLVAAVIVLFVAIVMLARENVRTQVLLRLQRDGSRRRAASRRTTALQERDAAVLAERSRREGEIASLRSQVESLSRPRVAARELGSLYDSGAELLDSLEGMTLPWTTEQELSNLDDFYAWLQAVRAAVLEHRPGQRFRLDVLIATATEDRGPRIVELAGESFDLAPIGRAKGCVQQVQGFLKSIVESFALG